MRRILVALGFLLAVLAPTTAHAATTAPTCSLRTFTDTSGQAFIINHLDGLDPLTNYQITLTLPDHSQQSAVGLAITPQMNAGFLVGTSFPSGTYTATLGQFINNNKVKLLSTSCSLVLP